MKSDDELIKIAQIGKSVGLKGELKLHLHCDFPEQFKSKALFYTDDKKRLTIERYSQKRSIVKFEGINDVDNAKKLTNRFLYTTKEQSKKECDLKDNEYFWYDLIGSRVYQDDLLLGTVKSIERFEPNDYLVIQTDKKLTERKLPDTFLIPYIDRYIIEFDDISKTVKTKDALDILKSS